MKIKTLKDLSDNFEVLSCTEEKGTLGGVFLTSNTDGQLYDIDIFATTMGQINYMPNNIAFVDSDPNNFGMSFSYTVIDDGNGLPTTININEGQWDQDRFSLLYIDNNNGNAFGNRVYLDNLTGYSFSCSGDFLRNTASGSGYEYESLPDVITYDAFGGYISFHDFIIEKYVLYDELSGGYLDYSRMSSVPTYYPPDPASYAGYNQQAIDNLMSKGFSSANSLGNILNTVNGSKLAAAKKAWDTNPDHMGEPFDYLNFQRSLAGQPPLTEPSYPIISIHDNAGSAWGSLKEFYNLFKQKLLLYGMDGLTSYFFENPW